MGREDSAEWVLYQFSDPSLPNLRRLITELRKVSRPSARSSNRELYDECVNAATHLKELQKSIKKIRKRLRELKRGI